MAHDYPWYEVVSGGDLQQGDLLIGLPIVAPDPNAGLPASEGDVPIVIEPFDVIVMTQSCDLANDKVEHLVMCPHWGLTEASDMDPELIKKHALEEIRKGRRPRYLLLAACSLPSVPSGVRIVDFGRVLSMPKLYVQQFAARLGTRLRLCPPYREHVAQSFARCYMRVGLPTDVRLLEVDQPQKENP